MSETPEILRLKQAERNLDQARKEHDRRVQDARQALKRAQKEQSRAIEEAERSLAAERTRWATPIDTFSDAQLFRDHVQRGTQSLPLGTSMSSNIQAATTPTPSSAEDAASQQSGQSASTPSASGQKLTQTLTLTLSTHEGHIDIPADPSHQDDAYEFASHVMTAGKNAAANISDHQHRLHVLEQAVQSAHTTAPQVDQAQKNLDEVEKAMGAIQSASLELDQVRQSTPPEILRSYDRNNKNRTIGIILGAVIIFIALVAFVAWFFMR
jgi:hypothetical protein